jgi:YVTN family beta-propeller protein
MEDRDTGSDRLWVVNQDNDSVSVFDTGSFARIAEINVGSSPRSVAVVGGQVWVTNKQTATISVIDSATLAITRTIVLPVGSQPFGIAVAPTGEAVYVVLKRWDSC